MKRRALLLASAAGLLAGASEAGAAGAAFAMEEVAPGVFVRRGADEEASVANQDGIANIGFVVGERSVAVIDPGGSRADGEALRGHLRGVTDKPISHVVFTHLHPDHVFGAVAFADDRPHFVANAKMMPMLVSRGEFYRNRLADVLGIEETGDYDKPDVLVADAAAIDLGGRMLRLQTYATAHTDNDMTVFDERTATLWAGDLLFVGRCPALDGSIVGWLKAIERLRAVPAARAVPGHGPASVAWPGALGAEAEYLGLIAREVRAMIARGGGIEKAVATIGQSERGRWALFDEYNGRNVTAAFKELEWE